MLLNVNNSAFEISPYEFQPEMYPHPLGFGYTVKACPVCTLLSWGHVALFVTITVEVDVQVWPQLVTVSWISYFPGLLKVILFGFWDL